MPMYIAYILGSLGAVACTVLMFIMVLPDKKRESLPKFFKIMHDIFNFKFLVLEYILKACYMVATFFCLIAGFFLLFSGDFSLYSGFHSYAGLGFSLMIGGPILLRVIYEFSIMFILLVKNTNQINRKMPKKERTPAEQPKDQANDQ